MTSRLKKKYSGRDNKGIIWGVLLENKLFEGLNDSQSILNEFEQQIQTIGKTIQQKDSIVSLNKKTINHMVSYIKYIKTQQQQKTNQSTLPNTSSAHTIEDIMKERQQHFKKTLNAKQEEFKKTIQGHIPKAIDFSDKAEQPIQGDMDRKLSELMEKRGVELNYLPKKEELKKATSWIQNGGSVMNTTTTTSNNQTIQLQIGEKVDLNELNDFQPISIYKEQDSTSFIKNQPRLVSSSNQKKVRFSDEHKEDYQKTSNTNDFLQMLKTTREPPLTQQREPQTPNTQSHIDENLSNQVNEMNTLLKTVLEKINTMEEKWNELEKDKREIVHKREMSTQTIINNRKKFKDVETNTNDIEEKIISPSQKSQKN